jgi:tripartite-type tricarboxylate transporter receptor subunit TctC
MPKELADKITNDVRAAVMAPDFKKKYIDAFSYVAVASTSAEFKEFLAQDRKMQGERIRISGAKLD